MFLHHVPVTTCRIFEKLSTIIFAPVGFLARADSKVSAKLEIKKGMTYCPCI